jgi:hypothetical protein
MHAPMIISAPEQSRTDGTFCAPTIRRGQGTLICFLGSAGPEHEVGVTIWLSLYLKEEATRASRRLVCWAHLSRLRMGRSV